MSAESCAKSLRFYARLPESAFPKYATSSYKGWRLQLTAPHSLEPKWHLSVSWTAAGNPDGKSLGEILSALGTSAANQWVPPPSLTKAIVGAFASVGKRRGVDVRHYLWDEEKPS
jgi:hypothetical protein